MMRRRVRTPTIIQMDYAECGAACLSIILAHFGKWVPLEELRTACDVTRNGSNAASMLSAARSYGLEAKGYSYTTASLMKQTPPFIIYWKFNHFLVVDGFERDAIRVNDPAKGHYSIDRVEFEQAYTGLLLKLTPGADFVRGGQPPSLLASLARRLGRSRRGVAAVLMLSLMLIIPGVLVTAFAHFFIDDVLMRGHTDWLNVLLMAMGFTIIAQGVMNWMQLSILLRIEHKLSLVGSAQLLWHLLRLPQLFFTQRMPGDLVQRLRANDEVAAAAGQDLGPTTARLIAAAFYVVIMLLFDALVAVVAIALTGTAVLITCLARNHLHDISVQAEAESGKLFGHMAATLQTITDLRSSGGEALAFGRLAGHHAHVVNAEQRLGVYSALVQALPVVTSALTTAVVLGLGAMRTTEGALTVGGIVAILTLVNAFKPALEDMAGFLMRIQRSRASLARVDDVMNHELDPCFRVAHDSPSSNKVTLDGRIELRSVSYSYCRSGPPLIADLDLRLEPGARVALVGGTGSGKSTVAKLVAGLYRPHGGQILLDDVPLDEWPLELRRNSIAWVDQTIVLFEGSVMDNLTLWDGSIPDNVVTRAARDAEIHDTITSRPGGYAAQVSDGGFNFSGGEAQRLELARALALEPSILVLDEATSALDPVLENRIDGHLRRRGCTTLIVAHRLSTIRDCDEIVVLERGRIVERGRYEWLMENGKLFRDLVQA